MNNLRGSNKNKTSCCSQKAPPKKVSAVGELVLKDIREKTGDLSTSDIIQKHMERAGVTKKRLKM